MKITTTTVHSVDYSDFEEAVNEFYEVDLSFPEGQYWLRQGYSFPADQESSNDVSHEFWVTGEVNDWDEKSLTEFKQDVTRGNMAHILLNDMCRAGIIPEGHYVIRVSW